MRNCYWHNFSMRSTMTNTPANNSYWQKKATRQQNTPLNRIYFYQAMLTKDDAEKSALLAKSVAVGGRDWAMTMQAYLNLSELALDKGQTQKAAAYYNMGKAEIDRVGGKH